LGIAELEMLIDKKYQNVRLPHPNRSLAAWHFLIAAEDALRFTLSRSDISTGSIEFTIDRGKYSLKYGLERIIKESTDNTIERFPRRVNGSAYERGFELFNAGLDHSVGCQICTSVHNGTVELQETDAVVSLSVDTEFHHKGYAVLEMLGHQPDDSISFMQIIFSLLHNEENLPFIVEQISRSIQVKGKLIFYQYESYLAADLSLLFSQAPALIPEDWQFTWGGRLETTLLLNALSIRCAYHFIAIHFGATSKGLTGGGCDDLILVIDREVLCSHLELLSSLPMQNIKLFIDALVYGSSVKSPDPALQPLFPLHKNLLAISPLHFLSCHMERNLLTLQARTDESTFNAMSASFERDMIASLMLGLSQEWQNIRPNITWKYKSMKEEFDLLVADPETRTIMVCEMKWTIQPGEPREVAQRKKVCSQKVSQVRRKIQWLKPNLSIAIKEMFGIEAQPDRPWTIFGLVVIEGFGGALSTDNELPIMPAKIFERAMTQVQSLEVMRTWSRSLAWLPQENSFFEVQWQELELEGKRIRYEGMSSILQRPDFLAHIDMTIAAANADLSE
jgi:hypothetical protein